MRYAFGIFWGTASFTFYALAASCVIAMTFPSYREHLNTLRNTRDDHNTYLMAALIGVVLGTAFLQLSKYCFNLSL